VPAKGKVSSKARSKSSPRRPRGPGTLAVHAGEGQEAPRRPLVVPIYQTAPFRFGSARELSDAFSGPETEGLYSRYANPTVRVVEEKIAALETADDGVAFASGMAAISATLGTRLRSGDRLLAAADIYGGTHAWLGWLQQHHPEIGVDRVPVGQLLEVLEAGPPEATRLVYFETPTNPLLACCDIHRVAEAAKRRRLEVVVDNTFATPLLQQPLALGADLVVHSATKFLGGHSDLMAGLVAGDAATMAEIRSTMMLGGACLDPHTAFLLSRGMKTLALRVERQSANAARLAAFLSEHPKVERVCYPGLDPVGRAQMSGGGGMLAFELVGGGAAAARLLDRLEVFQIVPSLGGVESGVMLPATTSHRQLSPAERQSLGIGDGLVRLSCGVEDGEDLEADLGQALAALG
jgi:cystathionine beta-lyase/cystathionine gamma-synthase